MFFAAAIMSSSTMGSSSSCAYFRYLRTASANSSHALSSISFVSFSISQQSVQKKWSSCTILFSSCSCSFLSLSLRFSISSVMLSMNSVMVISPSVSLRVASASWPFSDRRTSTIIAVVRSVSFVSSSFVFSLLSSRLSFFTFFSNAFELLWLCRCDCFWKVRLRVLNEVCRVVSYRMRTCIDPWKYWGSLRNGRCGPWVSPSFWRDP